MEYLFVSLKDEDYFAGLFHVTTVTDGEYVLESRDQRPAFSNIRYRCCQTDTFTELIKKNGYREIVVRGLQDEMVAVQLRRFGIDFDETDIKERRS